MRYLLLLLAASAFGQTGASGTTQNTVIVLSDSGQPAAGFAGLNAPCLNYNVRFYNPTTNHAFTCQFYGNPALTQAGVWAIENTANASFAALVDDFRVNDFGTIHDGVTDDTVAFQRAVDAAQGHRLIAAGPYRLGRINLHSSSIYEFANAIFSPTNGSYLFVGSGVSHVTIAGGSFSMASFSPTYSQPNGTYWSGVPITFSSGSSYITVKGQSITQAFGGVNLFDSFNIEVTGVTCYNCNAGIAVNATVAGSTIHAISLHDNYLPGCGDDGIAILTSNTSGTAIISDVQILHNYIDKSRFDSTQHAAVGIRTGYYGAGGVGLLVKVQIIGNILKDMEQEGLYLFGLRDAVIVGNIIDGYSRYATSAATVLGLSISTAPDAVDVMFIGNKATNPGTTNYYGIAGTWLADSTIMGNDFPGNVAGGFGTFDCSNCAGNIVTGNKFPDTSGPGITLRASGSSNNMIHHNDLSVNTGGSVTTPGGAGTGNVIEKNQGDVPLHSTTGKLYLCADTTGTLTLNASCSGT